ncbi:hypothetical protein ACFE04_003993 [Oxalis oulophora]
MPSTEHKFYMIGRDKNSKIWKVMKIDRLHPSELKIASKDYVTYSGSEDNDLVKQINEEDADKSTNQLKFVTMCYGLVGIIKLLGPYYMVIITKRRKMGAICGKNIYAISNTEMKIIQNLPVMYNVASSKEEKSVDLISVGSFSMSSVMTSSVHGLSGWSYKNPFHFNATTLIKPLPSLEDMMALLKSSLTLSQAAIVAFFSILADSGLHASMMYYLKARFHYNKDQFADLMVITGIAGTISQLLLMPTLAPVIREERLLAIGLLFSCVHMFLYGFAWSAWVPYVAAMFSILYIFAQPSLRSIVSKQVGSCEQGKAQGFISGICSLANVISPLIFSPLTALFLSEKAPFNFPGFSIVCIGFAALIAFIQSSLIRSTPPISRYGASIFAEA